MLSDANMHQETKPSLAQIMGCFLFVAKPLTDNISEIVFDWVGCEIHGPILLTWIDFKQAWINNHMHNKVWDEITYTFPNFNGISLGMDNLVHPTLYNGCNNLSMLISRLSKFSKRIPAGIIMCIHAPSQWEVALQCNTTSHWLGTYTD